MRPPWQMVLRFDHDMDPVERVIGAASVVARELHVHLDPDMLAKAVGPSRAVFQHRTSAGRLRRLDPGGHPSQFRPRDARGRFMRRLDDDEQEAASEQAKRLVNEELQPRLQDWLRLYEVGHITSVDWHKFCMRDLRLFYELVYREGKRAAGDPAVKLDPTDRAVLNHLLEGAQGEAAFLKKFADDMDAGKGRMAYHERLALYAQAAWEAYWNGWVYGDLRPGRGIRWRFGPTEEHCEDCAGFEKRGYMPVHEFLKQVVKKGKLPRSGRLACVGIKCRCWLQEKYADQESKQVDYGGRA